MTKIPNKSPKLRDLFSTSLLSQCYWEEPAQAQVLPGAFVIWDLLFGIYLVFGICYLEFWNI